MKRFVMILLTIFVTVALWLGPVGCGKKGPPVPKNPFYSDALDR